MEKLYEIRDNWDLDELNEVLSRGGKVKMIHSTSPGNSDYMSIVYVVVEI